MSDDCCNFCICCRCCFSLCHSITLKFSEYLGRGIKGRGTTAEDDEYVRDVERQMRDSEDPNQMMAGQYPMQPPPIPIPKDPSRLEDDTNESGYKFAGGFGRQSEGDGRPAVVS